MSGTDKSEIIPSHGDRNLGPMLIIVNWAVFGPSTIIVCLRVVTRIWITHNFGWDDGVMLLAQMVNAVGMGFVMLEVSYGLGRHTQYLPLDHYIGFLKYNYLDWIQVFITLALSKIAICLFLLRISKFQRFRRLLFSLIAFLIISHTPLTILFLLQCIPLNKMWDTQVPGHCFSRRGVETIIIIQGVFSIITDFICAGFPVVLLWNAKLNIRTKVALNMLMGLGVITGAICIVRTSYSWEVLSDDVTWVGVGNALTRILEVNFGVIGGCAPIMRPLYLHIRKLYFTSSHESIDSENHTTASQVQWYTPPSATPWYHRIWHSPEPKDHADGIPEKPEMIKVKDHNAAPKQKWPTKLVKSKLEKPENVTWAKDKDLETMDSFELPMQGIRRGENNGADDNDDEEIPDMFGTFRYHRGWV